MKSATSIQLGKAWWKKEAPEGLKKSGAGFEKALDLYAKANAGLRSPDARALEAFEAALEALEDAAKKVAQEARELAGKEKDKARKKDLENTAEVMDKPLKREIAAARAAMPEIEDDEDEDSADTLADPAQHAAYLKKTAGKLKKRTFNFALGLPSNEPEDLRLLFHPKKAGRGLAAKLKKAIGAKKFTFGQAGTEALSEEMGAEGDGARTLVLVLEGRNIPGLAKRVKLLLKKMNVSAFGRVKILKDGQEVDGADEATDEALEPLDMEAADPEDAAIGAEGDLEQAPEAAVDAPPPPPGPDLADLKARLAKAVPAIAAAPKPLAAELAPVAKEAGALLKAGDAPAAAPRIAELEDRLAAPPPPPPPDAPDAPPGGPSLAEQIDAGLKKLGPQIKDALANFPSAKDEIGRHVASAKQAARAEDRKGATEAMTALAAALKTLAARTREAGTGTAGVSIMKLGKARLEWMGVRSAAATDIARLKTAIRAAYAGHPEAGARVEAGLAKLDGLLETLNSDLQVQLDEVLNASDETERARLIGKVRGTAKAFLDHATNDPVAKSIDGTAFLPGIKVVEPIKAKLGEVMAALGDAEAEIETTV